ncbi:hypothetical protein HGO21_17065 [Acinetobacter sp. CUI P1]|nr:hypothetical protein [Acinetobacter sp. CUI P1]
MINMEKEEPLFSKIETILWIMLLIIILGVVAWAINSSVKEHRKIVASRFDFVGVIMWVVFLITIFVKKILNIKIVLPVFMT